VAQSTVIQVSGAVAAMPAAASLYSSSLQEFLSLCSQATYGAAKGGGVSVASTDMSPFVVPFEGITKGRMFGLALLSGQTMKVKMTNGDGVAIIPVSDKLWLHAPNPGDEFTAISLVGTGDVSYFLAGDTT
jgi:hypothetical protein